MAIQFKTNVEAEEICNIRKNELNKIPNECGAYVIHLSTGEYVGETVKLQTRIYGHLSNCQNSFTDHIKEKFEYVTVYITENHIDALILEKILIRKLEPTFNVPFKPRKVSTAGINRRLSNMITRITGHSKAYLDKKEIVDYLRARGNLPEPTDSWSAMWMLLDLMEEMGLVDQEEKERIGSSLYPCILEEEHEYELETGYKVMACDVHRGIHYIPDKQKLSNKTTEQEVLCNGRIIQKPVSEWKHISETNGKGMIRDTKDGFLEMEFCGMSEEETREIVDKLIEDKAVNSHE